MELVRILVPRLNLADAVVDTVQAMVRDGRLVPGELYSVQQLADELGVSRSPSREGLLRLAEAGMVSFERNRGFRINLPDARDIAEIFAVRLALEPEAAARMAAEVARTPPGELPELMELEAGLAAMRTAATGTDEPAYWELDRRLHAVVLEGAGNRRAARIVDDLRRNTRLLGTRTTESRSLADVAAEHEPVVAAIVAGRPEAARAAMHDHLVHTGRLLVAQALGEKPGSDAVAALWPPVSPG